MGTTQTGSLRRRDNRRGSDPRLGCVRAVRRNHVSHALFSNDAARLIYQYTKGIPRQVNNLCTAALLAGLAGQRKLIDESTVKQALLELQDEAAG
ncbi:MAG: hypothetical protein Q8P50_10470 [Bacillota bacterium]|nr:hypothetical protein [Bacillota bacterium]